MPSTYSPKDALDLVQEFAHGIPLTNVQAKLCDMINSLIWTFYPWGWSVGSLTPTNLNQQTQGSGSPPTGGALFTGNQQDYYLTGCWFSFPINLQYAGTTNNNFGGGWPVALATASTPGLTEAANVVTVTLTYPHNLPIGTTLAGLTGTINGATISGYNTTLTITSVPSTTSIIGTIATSGLANSGGSGDPGILRPLLMRICRIDTDPPEDRELMALSNLGVELTRTAGVDTMKAYTWFPAQNYFRFDTSPQVSLGNIIQLQGFYQIKPTKITNSNLNTPFSFPDYYFDAFVEGLKWKIYQLSDDPRAGGMAIQRNGHQAQSFTGQYGNFYQILQQMARTEDLNSGDQFQFPESPMGTGTSYWPGLFGI